MKKAFLVTFQITTRVIAEDQEEADKKAAEQCQNFEDTPFILDNIECSEEDTECPYDDNDIAYELYGIPLHYCNEIQKQVVLATFDQYRKDNPEPLPFEGEKTNHFSAANIWEGRINAGPGFMKEMERRAREDFKAQNDALPDSVTHTLETDGKGTYKETIAPDLLTLDYLKSHIGVVFASGVTQNNLLWLEPVRWIAKVGGGFHDWAIYYHHSYKSIDYVITNGDKVTTESVIRSLVPCSDEAFKLYRF